MKKLVLAAVLALLLLEGYVVAGIYSEDAEPDLSDEQVFNLQLRDIERLARSAFLTEPRFPDGNLAPILSNGGRSEYRGFVPHALPSMDDAITELHLNENTWHRTAMRKLRFSESGNHLISDVVGRIELVGEGNGFRVVMPECSDPILCAERVYQYY